MNKKFLLGRDKKNVCEKIYLKTEAGISELIFRKISGKYLIWKFYFKEKYSDAL